VIELHEIDGCVFFTAAVRDCFLQFGDA